MQKKTVKQRVRIERLACRLGTDDEQARIAVELRNGRVNSFAYYSKWKPQTCSLDVKRGDAFSRWDDTGSRTVVTLADDTGAFLIEHEPGRYHFIFREIDRGRYCGMEGKVNGSLTVYKGRSQCELEGVLAKDGSELSVQPRVALAPAVPEPESDEDDEPEIADMGVGGTTEPPALEIHVTSLMAPGAGQMARAPEVAPVGSTTH